MSTKNISKIIAAFVLVIVGSILITVIATQTNTITTPTTVDNEVLSIASARTAGNNINTATTFTLANQGNADAGGWVDNSVAITNSTGTAMTGNFTVNYATQTITFSNNTFMVSGGGYNNGTLVDYQYYSNNYLQGFGNTVLSLISGFFAIAVMLVGLGLFYSVAKDSGIV